jgi:EpsI family protein
MYSFQEIIPLKQPLDSFPVNLKGWIGKDHYFDNIILEKLNVSEYILREYGRGNDRVSLYIGYYSSQKQGAQIHSPKHCLPGSGWYKISKKQKVMNIDGVGDVSFIEAVYQKGEEKEMFIYWYKMKNIYITNEYILKLYMILNSLKYGRNDAAFLRLSTVAAVDMNDASRAIEDFMVDFVPLLQDYLPE